jgi:hypothetical protein
MIPDEWLQYVQDQAKELKRPPATPKSRMPRVQRMQSPRMRRIAGQTPNMTRAIFVPESEHTRTPTKPLEWRGTHEVGPGDKYNNDYRAGKATESR